MAFAKDALLHIRQNMDGLNIRHEYKQKDESLCQKFLLGGFSA